MNMRSLTCAALAFAAAASLVFNSQAQTVLAVDFSFRTAADLNGVTEPGFSPFLIDSNGNATITQTGLVTRTFGSINVGLQGAGANPGYTDRLRTLPTNNVDFTQSLLLRDFVFSSDTGSGGLNVTVDGLTAGETYEVTIWGYDQTSAGARYSDWTANSFPVKSGYMFNSAVPPTNNSQYQFSFLIIAPASGQLAIQGRRNSASGSGNPGVFLNALQVEVGPHDPPTNAVITANPLIYAGDNLVLTARADGPAPLIYHWLFGSTPIGVSSNGYFTVTNAQAGNYSVIVSNVNGTATSATTNVTLMPVANIETGLLAYWPLNALSDIAEDLTANENSLWVTNLNSSHLVPGPYAAAGSGVIFNATNLSLNNTNQYLVRTNPPGNTLPAYQYPAYTVAAWVNGFGTNQNDRKVYSESTSSANPLMMIGTGSGAPLTNTVDIYVRNDDGSIPINHRKTTLVAFDGTWHHIAWVDNNGIGTVYVDGVADTNNFTYTRGTLTATINTMGGLYRTAAGNLFNGSIDEVAVWRRALTSNEIAQVMTNGPLVQVEAGPRITSIAVGATTVTLTITTSDSTATHHVEEASDLSGIPIAWSTVSGVNFTPSPGVLTAEFPLPVGSRFYRVGKP